MSLDVLLSRLKKVKRTSSNSFMACCPAHDDRTPSLAISIHNEKILINCFAGCGTEKVLDSVGMTFSDLEPEKIISNVEKPLKQRVYPSDALRAIKSEGRILMLGAYQLRKNKPLSEDDLKRIELAIDRINEALEIANV